MVRSARLTKKLRRRPKPPIVGVSPEELKRIQERMEMYDNLTEEEALLVHEYGLAATINAVRLSGGRVAAAEAWLKANRERLQVSRWENTT